MLINYNKLNWVNYNRTVNRVIIKDLSKYMKSLDYVLKFKHNIVCPAHGPVAMPPKGSELINSQKSHYSSLFTFSTKFVMGATGQLSIANLDGLYSNFKGN